MDEIRAIESLDEMTILIKALLNDITESFISVGFYLKKTEQDELYKQAGYRNIWEYAKDTFGIGRSTASRFMDINTKYSIGGFSPQIDDKWRGYGSSKLTEMLGLPEEIQEAIPTEATVKDIREAKGIIRETEAHYDDQMELVRHRTGRTTGNRLDGGISKRVFQGWKRSISEASRLGAARIRMDQT